MAGKKYTLRLSAMLDKSNTLDAQLLKKKAELEKQGYTNITIKTTFDDSGTLKKYSTAAKDSFGNITREVSKYEKGSSSALQTVTHETEKATKATNYFAQGMMQSMKTAASYALSIGLIYKALAELQNGIQYIKDLDRVMTDARIVGGYTEEQTISLAKGYNELAKEMKVSTIAVADASLSYIRQGKDAKEAAELVRSSMIAATLGNLEAADSTKYLTGIMNAYKLEASELPAVIDKIIQLDNVFAVETADVAEGLQRSALSAKQANVSLEELSSMLSVIGQVTQRSGDVIGTSLNFGGC